MSQENQQFHTLLYPPKKSWRGGSMKCSYRWTFRLRGQKYSRVSHLKRNGTLFVIMIWCMLETRPSLYLTKLRTYLNPSASKSSTKIHSLGDATSTQVLRDLEISLRINHFEWVRDFLSEESRGLDVLIQYLKSRLLVMRNILELDEEEQHFSSEGGSMSSESKKSSLSKIKK